MKQPVQLAGNGVHRQNDHLNRINDDSPMGLGVLRLYPIFRQAHVDEEPMNIITPAHPPITPCVQAQGL